MCVGCFKALGVPAKHEIFGFLKQKESATVGELVKLIGLTQPTISHHLKGMQNAGLLKSKKVGKSVYYSIDSTCPYDDHPCVLENIEFKVNAASKN